MLKNSREMVVLVPIEAEFYDDEYDQTICGRAKWPSLKFVGDCAEKGSLAMSLELRDPVQVGMPPLNFKNLSFDGIFGLLKKYNQEYTTAYVILSGGNNIIMSARREVGNRFWDIVFTPNI